MISSVAAAFEMRICSSLPQRGRSRSRSISTGSKRDGKTRRLHIEVITRDDASASSPMSVLGTLDRFAVEFMLRDGDQLWLVVDRDSQSWKPREMADVARSSGQKHYFLAVSNPCFEVWLLVHFEDLSPQSAKRKKELFENKSGLLKTEVNRFLAPQKEYIDHFEPHTALAIERSKALDTKPRERAGRRGLALAFIDSWSNFSQRADESFSI